MATVMTPKRLGTDRDTLASILMGETKTRNGMIAVAEVMRNRARINFGLFGTSLVDQATAPNQFQGQTIPWNDTAYEIAGLALNDRLPEVVGTTALYYAADIPQTTAKWARAAINKGQGIEVGGNIFWADDKGKRPTVSWDNPSPIGPKPVYPTPVAMEPEQPKVEDMAQVNVDPNALWNGFATIIAPLALNIAKIWVTGEKAQKSLDLAGAVFGQPVSRKTISSKVYLTLPEDEKSKVLAAGYEIV